MQILALWLAILWTMPCAAQGAQTGIAMQGAPALPPDFTHLPYANPAVPPDGTLTIATVGSFDSLNPYIVKGTPPPESAFNRLGTVYESLLYRSADEPFALYPWLATPVLKDDRSEIVFALNPAARWADGTPVTADDVLFSWQTLKTQGRPNMRSYYGRAAADKIDALTVRFSFQPLPDGSFDRELPLIMGLLPVLPADAWQGRDFAQTSLTPPLGSGPYRVTQVDQGRRLVLARRDDYWGRDLPVMRGMTNFARIIVDFYRDETVARTAVLSGAADYKVESDPERMHKTYQGRTVQNGQVVTEAVAHHRPEPYRGLALNTRRAVFADKAVRQLLEASADFGQLNRMLFGSALHRSRSAFANSTLAGLPPEDLAEDAGARRARIKTALQAVRAAGYTFSDGQLRSRNGAPVTFELLLNDAGDERIALGLVRQWRDVGIAARVRTVDSAQFTARLNDFDYDAVVTRWVNSLSPGNEQALYWGSAAAVTPGSRNYAGVADAAIDGDIAQLRGATDAGQVQAAAQQLDRDLADGIYVIPFFYAGADLFARSARLHRPSMIPLTGYDLRAFWVDESK